VSEGYERMLSRAAKLWDEIDRIVKEVKARHPEIEKIEIRGHEWPPRKVEGPTDEPRRRE
jgi:hypothetical protein